MGTTSTGQWALRRTPLVVLPDGHLMAVNDNQGSTVTGPTMLMRFK